MNQHRHAPLATDASLLHRAAGLRLAFLVTAAVCFTLSAPPVKAGGSQEVSPAEKILFQTNHLKNVTAPNKLRYSYVRNGADVKAFKDEVVIDISKKNGNGSAVVSSRFLTGEREVSIPPIDDAEGNPALLGFLERDINEMKRLTGGSTNYFRKRIRLALADSAKVEPVSVSYKGQQIKGQRIAIQPYLNDPMQEKFSKYTGKSYIFIVSDQVPGTVYQIRTSIPREQNAGAGNEGDKLIEETMTVAGAAGLS